MTEKTISEKNNLKSILGVGFGIADYKSRQIRTVIVIASYPAFKLLKK